MKTSVKTVCARQHGPGEVWTHNKNISIRTEDGELKSNFLRGLVKSGSVSTVPAQLAIEILDDREKWKTRAILAENSIAENSNQEEQL